MGLAGSCLYSGDVTRSSSGLTRAAEEGWACANAYDGRIDAHGKLHERLQEALSSNGKSCPTAFDASAPGLITQCSCSSGSDILFQETEAPAQAGEDEQGGGTPCGEPAQEGPGPAPDTGSPGAAALCVRASTLRMLQGKKLSKRTIALENVPPPAINGVPLDEVHIQMQKHEEALAKRQSAAGSPNDVAAIMGHKQKRAKSQRPLSLEEARGTPDQLPHSEIIKQIQLLELRHGIKYVPALPELTQPTQSLSSSRSASTTGRIQTDHEGNAYAWLRFHQAKLANLESAPSN